MTLYLFLRRRRMTRTMDTADRSLLANVLEAQMEQINALEKRVADLEQRERRVQEARLEGYPGGR